MSSFEVGNVLGQFIMTFAIFVIMQFALSKIPPLRTKYAVTCGAAFSLALLLLVASSRSTATTIVALILFVATAVWRYNWIVKKAST